MSLYEKDSRKDSWVLSRFPFFLLRQFDDAASFVFNLKHFFPYLVKNRNRETGWERCKQLGRGWESKAKNKSVKIDTQSEKATADWRSSRMLPSTVLALSGR